MNFLLCNWLLYLFTLYTVNLPSVFVTIILIKMCLVVDLFCLVFFGTPCFLKWEASFISLIREIFSCCALNYFL